MGIVQRKNINAIDKTASSEPLEETETLKQLRLVRRDIQALRKENKEMIADMLNQILAKLDEA